MKLSKGYGMFFYETTIILNINLKLISDYRLEKNRKKSLVNVNSEEMHIFKHFSGEMSFRKIH